MRTRRERILGGAGSGKSHAAELPPSRGACARVGALGLLHQAVAGRCSRVTLTVAGCELREKDAR